MIISASYKTDIPAFYGKWFINRLRAGYCKTVNAHNGHTLRVSLSPSDVDAIVFWTKNIGPFLAQLPEIVKRGYHFSVQYSINGYPGILEYSVVDSERSVEHMHELANSFGNRVAVWRYDPIIFSSATPVDFHIDNFARLADKLEGSTDEVVVSFAQIYKKTKTNMNNAANKYGFSWNDPADDAIKLALAERLADIALRRGMQLTMCSQPEYLARGVRESRCVDVERLADVIGRPITALQKGNRQGCGCYASRDIGEYDTCPHGCVYCYAVLNRQLARQRYKAHDPEGEYLFPPATVTPDDPRPLSQGDGSRQLILFDTIK